MKLTTITNVSVDGVMQGHRTTRVLLQQVPEEAAAAVLADFGWD